MTFIRSFSVIVITFIVFVVLAAVLRTLKSKIIKRASQGRTTNILYWIFSIFTWFMGLFFNMFSCVFTLYLISWVVHIKEENVGPLLFLMACAPKEALTWLQTDLREVQKAVGRG
ncbi:hypothetical protein AD951_08395 [Acetobacter malorum]|uniref:Uncharacterized protein n=1 Tax=Acetobacter malorum TaxID=178901 RepID=A0A149UMB7_9PROT|nr:hypothetical protein AD951_08395 [Acetobacter malorum]